MTSTKPTRRAAPAVADRTAPWQDRAACASPMVHPDLFHVSDVDEGQRSKRKGIYEVALAVCGACPVRARCLSEALNREDPHGVWGGTTPQDRAALLGVGYANGKFVAL